MRRRYGILWVHAVITACTMTGAVQARAQSMYETYDGFTVSTVPALPLNESHPSLWFTSGEIPAIKAKKDASSYALTLWNGIASNVNSYKTKTASTQSTSNRPRMAKYCAFGWAMNADTVARAKAIEALLIAFDNVPRTASSANFGGSNDEIYRATWMQNYCAAYDWVQTELTAEQDSIIRSKLLWETTLLRNHMVDSIRYAPRPHNHRSKPAYSVGTAAVTFSSDSRSAAWLQFALTQQNTVTKYMFSAEGTYREGSHYNVYSLVNALPFLWHYKNVSGADLFPDYRPMFEYAVKLRGSKGWLPNIEDGYIKPYPTHMAARAYQSTQTELHPTEPLSKILQWNWFTTTFPTTAYNGATNDVTWDIDEYLTFDPAIPQVVPDFPPTIQTESGQVIFRDNSSFAQPVDRYLLFHGVAEADNHQHADLLSYILEYQGTILATDAGYGASGFSDALRSWYVSNEAHNTVTINGASPIDWSVNVRPTDLHFLRSPVADFAEKKAKTVALGGEIRRGILFPERKYWVVYDIGTSIGSATYRLNVHGRGALTANDNQLTWTVGADQYGAAARLYSLILGSASPVLETKSGYTSLFKDQVAQSWVEATQFGDSVMFVHLLMPGSFDSVFPQVNDLSGQGRLAFSVNAESDTSVFSVQRSLNAAVVEGMGSNARMMWANYSGGSLSRCFVNEATYLDWQGVRLFESDTAVTVSADVSVQGFHDFFIEPGSQPATLTIRPLWDTDTVEAVLFNRTAVAFASDGNGAITVTIPAGGLLQLYADATTPVEQFTPAVPVGFRLETNFPNPFNPSTRIRFSVGNTAYTVLTVYNSIGQKIRVLFEGTTGPGAYEKLWDGRNEHGGVVAGGLYIFELKSGSNAQRVKGIFLK